MILLLLHRGLKRLRKKVGLERKVARRVSQGLKPALILHPLCRD